MNDYEPWYVIQVVRDRWYAESLKEDYESTAGPGEYYSIKEWEVVH